MSDVSVATDTSTAIVEGALRALGRTGQHKLSMTDIAEEAGVSRGTLYRYFPNKEAVLHGASQYIRERLQHALEAEVLQELEGPERVRAVLHELSGLMESREIRGTIEVDPGWALAFLSDKLGFIATIVMDVLEETLTDIRAVRDGALTAAKVADLLVRLTVTMHLLPTPKGVTIPERAAALWTAVTDPVAWPPVSRDDRVRAAAATDAAPETAEPHGRTQKRIVDGAMLALQRRGLRKLSMSDIAEESGVSRGTLYRYFPDKEAVLAGVAERIRTGVKEAVLRAVEEEPAPEVRVRVVLSALAAAIENFPQAGRIIELEPAFALESLTRSLPVRVENVQQAMGPVLENSAPVSRGLLTPPELAGLLVRLVTSAALLPPSRDRHIPTEVQALWDSMHLPSREPTGATTTT